MKPERRSATKVPRRWVARTAATAKRAERIRIVHGLLPNREMSSERAQYWSGAFIQVS
jgi:hypothetical protein